MAEIQHTVTRGWQSEAVAHQKIIGAASILSAALITRIAYRRMWRGWYVYAVLPEVLAFTVLSRAKREIRAAEAVRAEAIRAEAIRAEAIRAEATRAEATRAEAVRKAFCEELNLTPVEFDKLIERAKKRFTDPDWSPATGLGRILVEGDGKGRPTRSFLVKRKITLRDGTVWRDVLVGRGKDPIGQGAWKKVYLGPALINFGKVGVRRVVLVRWKPKNPRKSEHLQLGLSRLPEFHHPNVDRPLGFVPKGGENPLQVLVEFCEGDLTTVQLTDGQLIGLLADMARGLSHLHAYGICHRDVKGGNLLVHKVGERCVGRVTDFDVSRWHPPPPAGLIPEEDEEERMQYFYRSRISHQIGFDGRHKLTGDPKFMAPECWEVDAQIGLKVDVWAFGILLYQFLPRWQNIENVSGLGPRFVRTALNEHPSLSQEVIIPRVGRAVAKVLRTGTNALRLPDLIPQERRQLIRDCLQPDQDDRPTMHQIVERLSAFSPWDRPSSSDGS